MRNPTLPPPVQALMAQIELAPQNRRADLIDQLAMGMGIGGHSALYQRRVDGSSGFSFIAPNRDCGQEFCVGFGDRLRAAIKAAGYRSERAFAIDMGWGPENGPQRVNNYTKRNRIPDRETLAAMARKLKTTPESLLNEADDQALSDILSRLLHLEGIPPDRADTIASVFLAARRLHSTSPDEGDPRTRARLAAQYAWQSQPLPEPDR